MTKSAAELIADIRKQEAAAREAHYNAMRAKVLDPEPNPATPQLKGEVRMELRVVQKVNFLAFFAELPQSERDKYEAMEVNWEYADWERPLLYLFPGDDVPHVSLLPYREGITRGEAVDVDETEVRVELVTGSSARTYGREAEWSAEHFAILRREVPWLDGVHRRLEALEELPDEEVEAERARHPGPLDVPLNLNTETQEVNP